MRVSKFSSTTRGRLARAISLVLATCGVAVAAADDVSFTRDIKPILSNRCFACHGPDDEHREADLRLDTFEGATADLGGYTPVQPGDPAASEILARVIETDLDIRMPPPAFGDALTPQEAELLRQWIQQGAKYEQHWSYAPAVRPDVPDGPAAIDTLVRRKLVEKGLSPSPQADPYLLARRVALDLTGLPPTLEQADRFAADPTDDAYAALVDELLASPRYGEHWASMWLDIARYADSAGYADDPLRTIWAYRDYVIRAFNRNTPFDEFTIEQLAGDMLPDPTAEQLIATAFHRNTLTNNEGGTDDEEFRNVAIVDRVNTTGAVWLGTTFACVQCHNHKYDPISQEEYFKVFAIFNQTEDTDKKDERPLHSVRTEEQVERAERLRAELAAADAALGEPDPELRDRLSDWIATLDSEPLRSISGRYLRVDIPRKEQILSLAEVEVFAGDKNVARGKKARQSSNSSGGFASKAVDGNTGGRFHADASTTHTTHERHPWWEVDLKKLQPIDSIRVWNRVGEEQGGKRNDGIGKRLAGYRVQILDESRRVVWQQSGQTVPEPSEEFVVSRLTDDAAKAIAVAAADRTDADWDALELAFSNYDPVRMPMLVERDRLDWALRSALVPATTVPVMRELPTEKQRETHVHIRGSFQSLGPKVEPGTPAYLPPLPDGVEPNRLSLAQWLVDDANPLTPRVLANRIWSRLFGLGLVRTVEDFGAQGELPTHPELLDWMASELTRTDWNLKRFVRTIVLSETYRQSAEVSEADRQRDISNEWLARGPRFRITAEMVRDQALAVSGLLSEKMYGPPVHPPQPKTGLKAAFGTTLEWTNSKGEDRYRRALYTEVRRSLPYPDLQIMDAPNREVCVNERSRTNTPLQAFLTLNGEAYVEASQAFAREIIGDSSLMDDEAKVVRAFRKTLIRFPSDAERARLVQLLTDTRSFYADAPEEAKLAATVPLGELAEGADVVEAAAWTSVCSVIMNLDEVFLRP